jgi:osmotically-inducible protein OsmY
MITDKKLQHDVQTELKWDPRLDAAHIGVTAKDGVVTLTGHTSSLAERYAAERAVRGVYGVRALANGLDVQVPGPHKRSDDEIAAACLRALVADSEVPDERITMVVDQGRVTLRGEVEWQFQRQAAERVLRRLAGIVSISNHIAVRPHISASDLREQIEAAFTRSAEVDARRVGIEVEGNKVTLRGAVRSWAEREDAARTAWLAPGVFEVENLIAVTP